MLKSTFRAYLLIGLATIGLYGCGNNDEPKPNDWLKSAQMMNESNGKTYLDQSDVYIDNANNFVTAKCQISSSGTSTGITGNEVINVASLSQNMPVVAGRKYQIFTNDILHKFSNGKIALRIKTGYYDVYVKSVVTKGNAVVGANVDYALSMVPQGQLPAFDNPMGTLKKVGDTVEMKFPLGFEYELDLGNNKDAFAVTTEKEKLTVKLLKPYDENNGPKGDYYIYVYNYDKWTRTKFSVK